LPRVVGKGHAREIASLASAVMILWRTVVWIPVKLRLSCWMNFERIT